MPDKKVKQGGILTPEERNTRSILPILGLKVMIDAGLSSMMQVWPHPCLIKDIED